MVLHTAVSQNVGGTLGWENNPTAQVSSYFVVDFDGTIYQCVDLDDKAWTQSAGNADWVGVENIGDPSQPLTAAQVHANARILAWLNITYGVPLASTDDPINGHGLGWHGMGGSAWGGHVGCPGDLIKAQRPAILADAVSLTTTGTTPPGPNPAVKGPDMLIVQTETAPHTFDGNYYTTIKDGAVTQILVAAGVPLVHMTNAQLSQNFKPAP